MEENNDDKVVENWPLGCFSTRRKSGKWDNTNKDDKTNTNVER